MYISNFCFLAVLNQKVFFFFFFFFFLAGKGVATHGTNRQYIQFSVIAKAAVSFSNNITESISTIYVYHCNHFDFGPSVAWQAC
jgi:hypothetical protein